MELISQTRYSHIDSLATVGYVITDHLVEYLNSSVDYKVVNTWGYGDVKQKDKLDGMMGHLLRNEVDMGGLLTSFFYPFRYLIGNADNVFFFDYYYFEGTIMFMIPERVHHIEFLSMINPTRGIFIFRTPPLSYISNIYYLPFAKIVWFCLIALVIISTYLIYLTFKVTKENGLNPSDYFLFAIGTVCQMGSHLKLKHPSGRIATVDIPF